MRLITGELASGCCEGLVLEFHASRLRAEAIRKASQTDPLPRDSHESCLAFLRGYAAASSSQTAVPSKANR